MRTEQPEEISRVSAAMTATEEILGFISVESSERPLRELALSERDSLSSARKRLDELVKELKTSN
jgi:hypothetical protein